MLYTLLALALAVFGANAATTVYFTNNENLQGGRMVLWSLDPETEKLTQIASWTNNAYTFGADVCDGHYYGFWADITTFSFGLIDVDISTGNVTFMDTDVLYHAVACDPNNPGTLISVGSVPGQEGAHFTIRSYDVRQQVDTERWPIPQVGFLGYDAVFDVSADGKKLYVGGGQYGPIVKGLWVVMEIATGKTLYGPNRGPLGMLPYAVFPETDPLSGIVVTNVQEDPVHHFAQFSFEDDKVRVKKGRGLNQYFDALQMPVCDGVAYASNFPNGETPLYMYGLNTQTGEEVKAISLEGIRQGELYFDGGIACTSA